MEAQALQGLSASRPWQLTSEAFERLLEAFDADRDRAGLAYEQMRARLVRILGWWGASDATSLADATFDRVARKVAEGAIVPKGLLGAYVRGVARMIFHESLRQPVLRSDGREPAAPAAEDLEAVSLHLDRCLARLAPEERELVLRYYGAGKAAAVRRELAAELGISATALRIRTHRLRERLERCVTGCSRKP